MYNFYISSDNDIFRISLFNNTKRYAINWTSKSNLTLWQVNLERYLCRNVLSLCEECAPMALEYFVGSHANGQHDICKKSPWCWGICWCNCLRRFFEFLRSWLLRLSFFGSQHWIQCFWLPSPQVKSEYFLSLDCLTHTFINSAMYILRLNVKSIVSIDLLTRPGWARMWDDLRIHKSFVSWSYTLHH